jgi:hypothetical protein
VKPDELEDLVIRFQAPTLPHREWTHHAHLSVGMWHVHHFGAEEALDRLREGIRRLNDSHGTPNSASRGYHETITRAYVTILAGYLASCGGKPLVDSVTSLLASRTAGRDYLLQFYSRARLMSVEARAAWIEPDLGDLRDR